MPWQLQYRQAPQANYIIFRCFSSSKKLIVFLNNVENSTESFAHVLRMGVCDPFCFLISGHTTEYHIQFVMLTIMLTVSTTESVVQLV